ncbi:MAG: AAA family ATPase [Candidatus Aenigmarchaeota archaeon]|nr:AAA family ATPase [Candidatus Aenigmarchaeota archaeon]
MAGAVELGFNAVVEGFSRNSDEIGPTYGLLQLDIPKEAVAIITRRGTFSCDAYTWDFAHLYRTVGEPTVYTVRAKLSNIGCCDGQAVVNRRGAGDDFYLGVAGLIGSGKGTISKYIAHRFGLQHLVCSDVIREELAGEGLEPTRDNMQMMGERMRAEYGGDIVVKKLLERVVGGAVFDGVRTVAEASTIKKLGGDIVFVHCEEKERFERVSGRDARSWEELITESSAPSERGIMSIYDIFRPPVIDNSFSPEIANRSVDMLVGALLHRAEIQERTVHIDKPSVITMADGRVFVPEGAYWGGSDMLDVLSERVGVAKSILFGGAEAVA